MRVKQWPMFLVASLSLVSCPQPPVPPQPLPSVDAGVVSDTDRDAASAATCASWCKHALALGCTSARPTRAGASCDEVCDNVQSGPAKWNLKCRTAAKSCGDADSCER